MLPINGLFAMKFLLALAAAASIAFFTGSCERHSWDDSKALFEEHHDDDHKGDKNDGDKKKDH